MFTCNMRREIRLHTNKMDAICQQSGLTIPDLIMLVENPKIPAFFFIVCIGDCAVFFMDYLRIILSTFCFKI